MYQKNNNAKLNYMFLQLKNSVDMSFVTFVTKN